MTPPKFSPGQHVLTTIGGCIAVVVVERCGSTPELFHVRRVGRTDLGLRFPAILRRAADLHSIVADPLTMNVAADWLEENGESAAAGKLRAAFPMPREDQ